MSTHLKSSGIYESVHLIFPSHVQTDQSLGCYNNYIVLFLFHGLRTKFGANHLLESTLILKCLIKFGL